MSKTKNSVWFAIIIWVTTSFYLLSLGAKPLAAQAQQKNSPVRAQEPFYTTPQNDPLKLSDGTKEFSPGNLVYSYTSAQGNAAQDFVLYSIVVRHAKGRSYPVRAARRFEVALHQVGKLSVKRFEVKTHTLHQIGEIKATNLDPGAPYNPKFNVLGSSQDSQSAFLQITRYGKKKEGNSVLPTTSVFKSVDLKDATEHTVGEANDLTGVEWSNAGS